MRKTGNKSTKEEKLVSTTETEVTNLPEISVLHAEDNLVNQKTFPKVLDMSFKDLCKFKWRVANNGKEAIEACNQEKFDIIFMDDLMPEMKGSEASPLIRRKSEFNQDTVLITNSDTKNGPYCDPDTGKPVSEHQIAKPTRKDIILGDVKFVQILTEIVRKKLTSLKQDTVEETKESDDIQTTKNTGDDVDYKISQLSMFSEPSKEAYVDPKVSSPHQDKQFLESSGAESISGDAPEPNPDDLEHKQGFTS